MSIQSIAGKTLLAASLLLASGFAACSATSWGSDHAAASDECPTCEMETEVIPVSSLTFKTHVCPTCSSVQVFDDYGENPTALAGEVHVCSHCETIVEVCALCDL